MHVSYAWIDGGVGGIGVGEEIGGFDVDGMVVCARDSVVDRGRSDETTGPLTSTEGIDAIVRSGGERAMNVNSRITTPRGQTSGTHSFSHRDSGALTRNDT